MVAFTELAAPPSGHYTKKLALYLGFFVFVHKARKRGKALLHALIELLVTEDPGIQYEPHLIICGLWALIQPGIKEWQLSKIHCRVPHPLNVGSEGLVLSISKASIGCLIVPLSVLS